MIVALLCGRKGSKGLSNKNLYPVLGRPLGWYPLQAAVHSRYIDKIYISTDSKPIAKIGKRHGAHIIPRPAELTTDKALLADVLQHGVKCITGDLKKDPDFIVILLCNAATVTAENIDKGIEMLQKNKKADSVATVALLNQYSPIRAKKIVKGRLVPAIDIRGLGESVTCDRRCMGDVYFCDASLWILRPRCMNYKNGQPPFPWMGRTILPIIQQGGLDVDDKTGIYLTEQWLKQHGFSRSKTPYD